MKQIITDLIDYSLEIIAKFQKDPDHVSLSKQTQQNLNKYCQSIIEYTILPETKFENDLFEFIFRFYKLPLSSPFFSKNKNDSSRHSTYRVFATFLWFLTYKVLYLENISRLAFVLPSKVDVNQMLRYYPEQCKLVEQICTLMSLLLSSLSTKETIISSNLVLNPGLNAENILIFFNTTFCINLTFNDLVSIRNLMQFDRYEPQSWGSHVWQMLHFISYYVYIFQKDTHLISGWYFFIMNNLQNFLPCDICSTHWEELCIEIKSKQTDLSLSPSEMYFQLFSLHNRVRADIGLADFPLELFKNSIDTPFFEHLLNNFIN